jgi:hypothetical protein
MKKLVYAAVGFLFLIGLLVFLSRLTHQNSLSAAPAPQSAAPALPAPCVAFRYMLAKNPPKDPATITEDEREKFLKWIETNEFSTASRDCFSKLEQQVKENKDPRVQVQIMQQEVLTLLAEGLADKTAMEIYWQKLHDAGLR